MKVDIDAPFLDNRRKIARRATGEIERDPETGVPILNGGVPVPILASMSLADVFIEALADRESDQGEPPRDKLRRARLSDMMLDGGTIELTPADVTMIQKRAGNGLTSTAYLRVVEVLGDPDAESGPAEPDVPPEIFSPDAESGSADNGATGADDDPAGA